MIKNCLLFTTLFLTSAYACAQQIQIVDQQNLHPLENVIIYGEDSKMTLFTDQNGEVDITLLKDEKNIRFSHDQIEEKMFSYADLTRNGNVFKIQRNGILLDEMIIFAQKWEQHHTHSAQKVVAITPKDIQFYQPQTTADLLGNNANIFIQKSQLGGGSPMIRGFSTNRVMITVDGVRMNNAIFRSGNLQNVIAIDPNAIAKTEVVMGPGSLIYGSDAIGGVMNFFTLKPQFSKDDSSLVKGEIMGRYSTANQEETMHAHLNITGQKFSSLTSFSYSQFNDLKMGKHGPEEYLRQHYIVTEDNQDIQKENEDPRKQINSGYEQYNVMQKFRYAPKENWDLNYGFHYSTTNDVPRYDRFLVYRNGKLRFAEWYYGPQTWMMNNLSVEHKAENAFFSELKLNLAHQLFEESRHSRNVGNPIKTNQYEKVNVYSANLDVLKKINHQHTLYYGAETLFNKVNSTADEVNVLISESNPVGARYPNHSTWNSFAVYLSHEYSPTQKVTLQAGLRYNYVSSKSKFDLDFYDFPFDAATIETGKLTGNIGLNYHPTTSTKLRAMFSTAFRAPNIDDIGKVFESEPGAIIVPNPNLKDEYAYSGEVGFTQKFGRFAKLDVAAYYIHLKDALVRRDFNLNGQDSIMYQGEMSRVQAIQNAAKAYSYGIESQLDLYLSHQLTFKALFNYQKGEEELDNGSKAPMRHISPLLLRLSLDYQYKKIRSEIYMQYNGEISNKNLAPSEQEKEYMYAIDGNGNPYSPSWYSLNVKGLYDFNRNVSVSAAWENFTNQRYRPYSSGIVAAGSNFILSVSYRF